MLYGVVHCPENYIDRFDTMAVTSNVTEKRYPFENGVPSMFERRILTADLANRLSSPNDSKILSPW